ncbi:MULTISPECIES: hypothetical protein [unclassified Oceanobacter]|jgi:hypothetical protein|uniref:hypothetical protein n=1 Tax=unclassified Oceanobacter TaxID=2620260 RepID=UPI0026E45A88|nr:MULTISPECIES: hypothetical protein [unclassified Oceanobacter]MDO6681852.1 hypothetical protein [Oceanobacter sp. 5_MG-2023]MDP2506547.1 hypothetical protein [Oceanobacter sp. 3_MG-2023]MDP2549363.1 hypothetical protein [Oceanobacter sp. 4_MG-2023]MDP2609438.1 hypothetical protein [Oceanobacter sp. 1_MG-2023]MDP2612862.1 hypothetical protein [Oceanobacter sp. 2_MG-2023]
MMITYVKLPWLDVSQAFVCFRSSRRLPENGIRTADQVIIDHTPSTVAMTDNGLSVLKLIKARSWHEYVKTLWAHSRLFKEVQGNRLLTRLGVHVAAIHEVGIGLLPGSRYRYLGYYIMEDLASVGAQEVFEMFLSGGLTPEERIHWLDLILDDLRTMRDAGVVFSDCHLNNVFAHPLKQHVIWIDTGVTRYFCPRSRKFARKFNYSIRRLADYHDQHLMLTLEEKRRILALLLPE